MLGILDCRLLDKVDWIHTYICSFKYLSAFYEPNNVLGAKDTTGIKKKFFYSPSPHGAYIQVGGDRSAE